MPQKSQFIQRPAGSSARAKRDPSLLGKSGLKNNLDARVAAFGTGQTSGNGGKGDSGGHLMHKPGSNKK